MSNERTGVLELTLGDNYIGSAYSPQVEVTDTDTGHEVAITYMSPEGIVTERFDVADGEQGPQGPAGFSPTVTITDTPTGHTVTITDEDGPHSYDVPNYAQEEQQRQDAWDALSDEVTDAISNAETATSAASTAATSATSAATSATTAAQAATTAAASASTAASSANAAATAANTAANAASTAADAATTAAGDATDAASAANTAAQAAQEAATELAPEVAWLWGNQLTGELTGDLLTTADAYAAPPMALTVDGRSTQDGTPTPDAPVPIESVDELALAFAGKNLLQFEERNDTIRGVTISMSDNVITVSGTPTVSWAFGVDINVSAITQAYHPIAGESYTFSVNGQYSNFSMTMLHDGDSVIGTLPSTVTWNAAWNHMSKLRLSINTSESVSGSFSIQMERSATPTAYEPYAGHTVPIDLQDHVLRSLPDGTRDTLALAYLRPSTREGWAVYSRTLTALVGETTTAVTDGVTGTVGVDVMSTTGEIADGPTVLYKLATPITTQFDPIELPILPAPTCTVWSDPSTGLQMEYVRDSNLVVQSLSAETAIAYASIATVDGPTATASHATGTYLTMGGTLYKVTQAIAVGETIAAGTNVTATTVMAELIARTA